MALRVTYDLRRLRLHGSIQRVAGTHRYLVTLRGWQVAGFCNTLYQHVLRPGWATLADSQTHVPDQVSAALRKLADVTRSLFNHIHPEHSAAA